MTTDATDDRGTLAGLHVLLAACGGFLLSTLWFDLMFDSQVLGTTGPLPDAVIASIAAYYRRVTTEAHPMERMIAAVMLVTVAGSAWAIVRRPRRPIGWMALVLAAAPIALAAARVFPNAVRLGARDGSLDAQGVLARSIFADHVRCLVAIALFTGIQITLATRAAAAPRRDGDP